MRQDNLLRVGRRPAAEHALAGSRGVLPVHIANCDDSETGRRKTSAMETLKRDAIQPGHRFHPALGGATVGMTVWINHREHRLDGLSGGTVFILPD